MAAKIYRRQPMRGPLIGIVKPQPQMLSRPAVVAPPAASSKRRPSRRASAPCVSAAAASFTTILTGIKSA